MSILGTNVSDIPESIGTVTWCSGLHDVIADIGIFQMAMCFGSPRLPWRQLWSLPVFDDECNWFAIVDSINSNNSRLHCPWYRVHYNLYDLLIVKFLS